MTLVLNPISYQSNNSLSYIRNSKIHSLQPQNRSPLRTSNSLKNSFRTSLVTISYRPLSKYAFT